MKRCPLCNREFDDDLDVCTHCNVELIDEQKYKELEKNGIPKSFWISLIAVFGFMGGLIILYNIFYAVTL